MKIYFVFSPAYSQILRTEQVKVLVNYATLKNRSCAIPIPRGFGEVIIDSGGYQLQVGVKTPRQAKVENYCFWLETEILNHYPEVAGYMNLDILDLEVTKYPLNSAEHQEMLKLSAERTLDNQITMESAGLKPIPVWHAGEPEEYLDFYCSGYSYVSIGGMASMGTIGKQSLVDLCQFLFQKHPNTKFHLFGIGLSGIMAFKRLRPYSVDFSTWSVPARYGHDVVYDDKRILKEIKLPEEIRNRLRTDKPMLLDVLRGTVKRIKYLEDTIDSYHDPYQKLLL